MFEWFFGLLVGWGVADVTAVYLSRLLGFLLIVVLSLLAYFVARRYLLRFISYSVTHTETRWDDILDKQGVFTRLAQLAPAMVIYLLAPLALEGYAQWIALITNAVLVYVIVILTLTINAFITAIEEIFSTYEWSREIPIRSFVQVLKIVVIAVGVLMVAFVILDQTLVYILGSLGAVTAVLTIVFQDFILGLVAGVQLTANGMIARGDWVSVPKFDADGTVLEIGLTTIKIQNADNSITTIPTQSLITESFKNWRGMQESDGRRIKRSLLLDMNSVQRVDDQMLAHLEQVDLLPVQSENGETAVNHHLAGLRDRYPTNVGVFRAYVETYLRNHPHINTEMTLLVRQLASEQYGLPIEIYAFSKEKAFVDYEQIQAGIFEHLLAILPDFHLRVYQTPAGHDMREGTAVASKP